MGADLQSISTFLDRWRTSRASAMNWAAAIAAALAGVREGISTCEAIPTCQVILYLRSNPYVPSNPLPAK